jgi:hypothetical protein
MTQLLVPRRLTGCSFVFIEPLLRSVDKLPTGSVDKLPTILISILIKAYKRTDWARWNPVRRDTEWVTGVMALCRHLRGGFSSREMSATNLLDNIGSTPLVKLDRVLPDAAKHANVLAKLEFQVKWIT